MVPTCTSSKAGPLKLERVQNVSVKKAAKEGKLRKRSTNESLHNRLNIEPINTRLYDQTNKILTKLRLHEPELVDLSNQLNAEQRWEHSWWPTVEIHISKDHPVPSFL